MSSVASPSIAASSAGVAAGVRCPARSPSASTRRRPRATGMMPAFISSVTASPASRSAHDVRGAERRVAGERHLERRREDPHVRGRCVEGNTNVVSDRLNWSASACIVASSRPRASSNTHSGFPARGLGEDVDDAERIARSCDGLRERALDGRDDAPRDRAERGHRMPAGTTVSASTTRGKLRSIERA